MRRRAPLARRHLAGALLATAAILGPAAAQDDDGPGFIGRQIENALSGPGREVRVSGFEGALSGRATMARMTIADADGIWLTLEDAVLDWNRAALLRGRLSVNELSADRIAMARTPAPAPDERAATAPAPEASGFSLPQLPVAINIGSIEVGLLDLAEPVFGEEALFRLDGRVLLDGGEADLALGLSRLGGPEDRIAIDAAYSDDTRQLALDLTVREGPGGLVSSLIGIPGAPSIALDIDGTGPIDDFTAAIDLSTRGVQRLGGEVTLRGTDENGLRFAADVGGDITPIILPDYAEFFGPDVSLVVDGVRAADGALTLERLDIGARSLDLEGSAALDAEGRPVRFALSGSLADPDGDRVRLPSGPEITLAGADLSAAFDRQDGEAWTLDLSADALDAPGLAINTLSLNGSGEIDLDGAPAVTATLTYAARGLAPQDAALADALGPEISGAADLRWRSGAPLELSSLTVAGADYGAEVTGTATFAERTLMLDGQAEIAAQDLSRFSAISGQDLTGRATVRLGGTGDILGGVFDVTLDVEGEGLSIGQETADRFLEGPVTLSAAARRDLGGTYLDRFALDSTGISASAAGAVGSGITDVEFDATLKDIGLVQPDWEGPLTIGGSAAEQTPGLYAVDVTLDGPYGLTGGVDGSVGTGDARDATDVSLDISLPDLAPLVPQVAGPVSVRGTAAAGGTGLWDVDLAVDAPEGVDLTVEGRIGGGQGNVGLTARVPEVAAFVPGIPGAVALDGRAEERDGGQWQIDLTSQLPYSATAAVQGEAGPQDIRLTYSARVPDVGAVVPGLAGALAATGTVQQAEPGRFDVTADVDGPYAATAEARATVGGGADGSGRIVASLDLAVPDLSPLSPALRGGLTATASARQKDSGAFEIDLGADGPFGSTATAEGSVGGGDTNATARVRLPDVGVLAPRFAGALTADITASQSPGAPIDLTLDATAPYGTAIGVDGRIGQGQGQFDISAAIPNIAPFAPGLRGAINVNGTVTERPQGWGVDIQSRGPATAAIAATGIVATDGSGASLRINGDAPLALVNGILAPQRLEGDVRLDLALDGPPGLNALSGTISTSGAQLQIPSINLAIADIGVTAQLGGGTITLDASARSAQGGGLTASGPITLSGGFPADLAITIDQFVLSDPSLFQTSLNGDISVSGPLVGQGGTIAGQIDIGETELRIPAGGAGFGGAIPRISHLNEPADVFLSRERAGLVNTAREDRGGTRGRTAYGLDLRINAPRRIFLRGRGLDAELGGEFRIGGTTRRPAPVGAIEVIRGRLDLLGKRLELEDSGTVTLGGDLVPFLDLLATSDDASDFTILIEIRGPVNEPVFTFNSSPQLPEDEVLARFFFGRGIANLSPIQAAQLANSIAQLTGRGGTSSLIGGLREGLGVDDFNIVTDDEGDAALQIGQYLTDNIYTDVVTSTSGSTEFHINIDLTDTITVTGSADNEGETSLGIFFERDY